MADDRFRNNAVLYLAKIDNEDGSNSLVDCVALNEQYQINDFPVDEFKNPMTGGYCKRIRVLEFNRFGRMLSAISYRSISDFQAANEKALKQVQVMNALLGCNEKPLTDFSLEELQEVFKKAFMDPTASICINWEKVNSFLTDENNFELANLFVYWLEKQLVKSVELYECLGDFFMYRDYSKKMTVDNKPFSSKAAVYYRKCLELGRISTNILADIILVYDGMSDECRISHFYNPIYLKEKPSAIDYCVLGEAFLDARQLVQALKQFKKAIQVDPECYLAQIKLEEVRRHLEKLENFPL